MARPTGIRPVPIACTLERTLAVVNSEMKHTDIGLVGTPTAYPFR